MGVVGTKLTISSDRIHRMQVAQTLATVVEFFCGKQEIG